MAAEVPHSGRCQQLVVSPAASCVAVSPEERNVLASQHRRCACTRWRRRIPQGVRNPPIQACTLSSRCTADRGHSSRHLAGLSAAGPPQSGTAASWAAAYVTRHVTFPVSPGVLSMPVSGSRPPKRLSSDGLHAPGQTLVVCMLAESTVLTEVHSSKPSTAEVLPGRGSSQHS